MSVYSKLISTLPVNGLFTKPFPDVDNKSLCHFRLVNGCILKCLQGWFWWCLYTCTFKWTKENKSHCDKPWSQAMSLAKRKIVQKPILSKMLENAAKHWLGLHVVGNSLLSIYGPQLKSAHHPQGSNHFKPTSFCQVIPPNPELDDKIFYFMI